MCDHAARAARRIPGLLALGVAAAVLSGCHEPPGVKVSSVTFHGNHAIGSDQLKSIMATQGSGRLPWSTPHEFDRSRFDADLQRLTAYYADRGYPHARVTGVTTSFNGDRTAVALSITVDEGAPTLVEELRFRGFDVLPAAAQQEARDLPLRAGQPLDRQRLHASHDYALAVLRDNGYARAVIDVSELPGTSPDHVVLLFAATPGPVTHFGALTVTGLQSVGPDVVRRELAFHPGGLFRQSLIDRTQRRLLAMQLFQFVNVVADTSEDPTATTIPMRVTIVEAKPRKLTAGVGYGSEERFRASLQWSHLNFLGGARQATIDTKWSSIDRGARVTFLQPYLLGPNLTLTLNGGSWWTDQLDYHMRRAGARAMVTYKFPKGLQGPNRLPQDTARLTFIHEYLSYGIQPESLGDLTLRTERIALGFNPDTGTGSGTLGALDLDLDRTALDNPLAPRSGYAVSLHTEQAEPWLGGTYRFHEYLVQASGYVPVSHVTLALRARVGSIAAASDTALPFSARYFLGGATSLRGWGRFEVAPLDANGLPIGGRSLAEAGAEVHVPLKGRLSGVLFADAGNVWPGEWQVDLHDLRYDVGPGLRYETPIGELRVDLGYQLNPILGLIVDGKPQPRRWRIHFGIGPTF